METAWNILTGFFEYGILLYCLGVMSSYLVIGVVSAREILRYQREDSLSNLNHLLASPLAPSISIIAPAYNESMTIVDNIRSLLSLHYDNLTVIVVNDGSKDDTLAKAIASYDLELMDFFYDEQVSTKKVRGVYRSKNSAFRKLIFVDKENGGKADAINVGINVADSTYFACIDVDCIIEQDAFLKMAKPVMQGGEERIVAVGGIVWLTNDSEITNGKLIQVKTPKTAVPKFQVLEYFRAFLLGRTAWSKFNGLLLISGAFGLFDRDLVIEVGGYNHNTVGEDMELVMRMHARMRETGEPYKIEYIPDPLCWTEAPADYNILSRQRNRWTRGTIECLTIHKKMLFNRKFGVLGMVSYPYWLLAEWAAPFVEAGGLIFFFWAAFMGMVNWPFFFALLVLVYVFALTISFFAILVQELTCGLYTTYSDILQLMKTAIIEPFVYHPRTVSWSLRGNYDFFTGANKGWGEMTRAGFSQPKDT